MDLMDPSWHGVVQESYDSLVNRLKSEGLPVPRQTTGAHRLDRAVINRAIGVLRERGVMIETVRAAFLEGEPLYPSSAVWSRAHVQIAVRDPRAILRLWREL